MLVTGGAVVGGAGFVVGVVGFVVGGLGFVIGVVPGFVVGGPEFAPPASAASPNTATEPVCSAIRYPPDDSAETAAAWPRSVPDVEPWNCASPNTYKPPSLPSSQ